MGYRERHSRRAAKRQERIERRKDREARNKALKKYRKSDEYMAYQISLWELFKRIFYKRQH